MKFFDTDWSCIFHWLAVWEELSVPARRHYLLAATSHAATVSAEGYGADGEVVLEAGLVEPVSSGRVKPTAASVPFRALMAPNWLVASRPPTPPSSSRPTSTSFSSSPISMPKLSCPPSPSVLESKQARFFA
jgi:hypothetical protein